VDNSKGTKPNVVPKPSGARLSDDDLGGNNGDDDDDDDGEGAPVMSASAGDAGMSLRRHIWNQFS